MSGHLLVITLGPVQDFISAARRTRDLWYGSLMLSEISKAAAKAVKDNGGNLIFPAPADNAHSFFSDENQSCVNVILAALPALNLEKGPEEVADRAQAAAENRWKEEAAKAMEAAKTVINERYWNAQLEDVIEFYAAWTPLTGDYKKSRQRVMQLLAGRKACRDFKRWQGYYIIPKSSLDGARESVFVRRETRIDKLKNNLELAQRLRLNVGEELDAIGLTKRAARKEAFPSVTRLAADPWIRGVAKTNAHSFHLLGNIRAICQKLAVFHSAEIDSTTGTGSYQENQNNPFPYDGALLFPNRIDSYIRQRQNLATDDEIVFLTDNDIEHLKTIKQKLTRLISELKFGEPDPYLAFIFADGDRMGATLDNIDSLEDHQAFSKALADFANASRHIAKKHYGHPIYAGADDIMVMVPVDQCIACARELYEAFKGAMRQWSDQDGNNPTLSVGVAIGHCLDPLEDLLNFARAAESNAKLPDRNGLAVHVHPRSGPPIIVRGRWYQQEDKETSLDCRLQQWVQQYINEQLPDRAAYDLRTLAHDYAHWTSPSADDAIIADVRRLLARKMFSTDGPDAPLDAIENLLRTSLQQASESQMGRQAFHPGVMRLADEWLVARRIAKSAKQACTNPLCAEPEESDA